MKILILGYKGMLGQELASVFREDNELVLRDRSDIDIADRDEVIKKIRKEKPDIVINAAAYTNVDRAESEVDLVYKVNGYAVGYLAAICKETRAIFIHFSTDYVFSGENQFGYKENDNSNNSVNIYGKSKLLGEKMIQDINPKYYLIRTSWLFGKHGKNFVETMLQLALEKKEIKVVFDQFGCPTYAKDLAKRLRELVELRNFFGIYHITNSGSCNWHEFAKKIFEFSGVRANLKPVKTDEFSTPAKRPKYSILLNTKLFPMRSWQDALKDYLVETGRRIDGDEKFKNQN